MEVDMALNSLFIRNLQRHVKIYKYAIVYDTLNKTTAKNIRYYFFLL